MVDHEKALEDFLCFYEDLYTEFSKFGRIDALHVCDNLGELLSLSLFFYNLANSRIVLPEQGMDLTGIPIILFL